MKTSSGACTGGIWGVLTTIQTTLSTFPGCRRCLVVFDSGHSQRRLSVFPEYKKNREPPPEKAEEHSRYRSLLETQKIALLRIIPSLGLRLVTLPSKEGDDILGWLSEHAGGSIVIASEDKDMFQLVGPNVAVYRPIRKEFVTTENFRDMAKVPRKLFLLRKAILGDPSDNIDGVPKAGEVTADKLMETVEYLIQERKSTRLSEALTEACQIQAGADSRGKKRYESVLQNLPLVARNLDLMDLRREPFTDVEEAHLRTTLDSGASVFEEQEVLRTFKECEFASLLDTWADFSRPFRVLR